MERTACSLYEKLKINRPLKTVFLEQSKNFSRDTHFSLSFFFFGCIWILLTYGDTCHVLKIIIAPIVLVLGTYKMES